MQKAIYPKTTFLLFLCLIFTFFSSGYCFADSVDASYQSISGKKVVFMVKIGNPAPQSLIVTHRHPASNKLISASPAANKLNHKAGVTKWLLKNVRPGVYPFSLSFTKPISPGAVSLTLNHRDKKSNSIIKRNYRP